MKIKSQLHHKYKKPEYPHEGDVFWYHCGENIGTEMCGKGEGFFRPCVIYRVLSQYTAIIIPLSTQLKEGSWYVPINSFSKKSVACLHQQGSIDTRRLHRKMGEIAEEKYQVIEESFVFLFTKINPHEQSEGDPEVRSKSTLVYQFINYFVNSSLCKNISSLLPMFLLLQKKEYYKR